LIRLFRSVHLWEHVSEIVYRLDFRYIIPQMH